MDKLNELCRKKRRAIEMSQFALAEQIGVNQSTISNFEKGKINISSASINKILKILEIELS